MHSGAHHSFAGLYIAKSKFWFSFWTTYINSQNPNCFMRISQSEFGAYIGKYNKVLYLCHRNAEYPTP